jgi:hypothetical protein
MSALPEREKVVAVAGEHRAHAGLAVHTPGEFPGDLEHHVLLAGPGRADRTGILAAMPGVDGHHDLATGLRRCVGRPDGSHGRRRHGGRRHGGRRRRGRCRPRGGGGAKFQHEPGCGAGARLARHSRRGSLRHLDHHAQVAVRLRTGADPSRKSLPGRHGRGPGKTGAAQVDDGAPRCVEQEEPVLCRAGQLQHDTRPALTRFHPDRARAAGRAKWWSGDASWVT